MKIRLILLGVIVFIAGFLRLYQINSVPPHLSNDEISLAFDSYSLLTTAKDQHGRPFPVSLKSHGDYKAPLYSYLATPFVFLLGNTTLAVKLPSVIAGVLTVLVIFYLSLHLTRNPQVSLFSALVAATSFWSITTSHGVAETNLALLFLCLGVLFLIRKKSLPLSALFLAMSMYGYHTEKGLVPLIILVWLFVFRPKLKAILTLLLPLGLLLLPQIFDLGTTARAGAEVIWNETGNNFPKTISVFVSNYFAYINPGYLFFSGLGIFHGQHPYNPGLFTWPLVIPFFLGLFQLKPTRFPPIKFLLLWLIVSPVIPALTHGGPSLLRNLTSLAPLSLIIGQGMHFLFKRLPRLFWILAVVFVIFTVYYLPVYYYHFPRERAGTYQGYRPIAEYLRNHVNDFTHVQIDDRFGPLNEFIGVPHLFIGFYSPLSPSVIQSPVHTPEGSFYADIFSVSWINWTSQTPVPSTWYIVGVGNTPPDSVKKNYRLVTDFPDISGKTAFEIWTAI